MTTVAYDGKVLAADTLICNDGVALPGPISKIWTLNVKGNHLVVAGAGNPTVLMALARLFGEHIESIRTHHALVPAPTMPNELGGSIIVMDAKTGHVYFMGDDGCTVEITGRIWACGSGRRIAIGAMAAGASARKAVKIAAIYDVDTGHGDVEWVEAQDLGSIQSWMEVP